MSPEEFIEKWRHVEQSERATAQSHFIDLCRLLDVKAPTDEDKTGDWYAFEKPATAPGETAGVADVWRKDCFVWEYKRKGKPYKTLQAARGQAREYAARLNNPPLIVVCDIQRFIVQTNFQGLPSIQHEFALRDLVSVERRQLLRRCFLDPQSLKPDLTAEKVTAEAAEKFAVLAQNLRARKVDPHRVAHFLNRLVFCLFAEDIGLLDGAVFSDIVEEAQKDRSALTGMLSDLFGAMRVGRRFGATQIRHFNGGLFDDDDAVELSFSEVQVLAEASKLDWKYIEPSIFGTLFEKGLDPQRRKEMAALFDSPEMAAALAAEAAADAEGAKAQAKAAKAKAPKKKPRGADKGVGIHYTDPATIMKIVEPVVLRPLRAEWEAAKAKISKAKTAAKKDEAWFAFCERLRAYRVLDPACGSGNFLYLALRHLHELEHAARKEADALGCQPYPKAPCIGPHTVAGIEINPYAAELARVTIWIGELQWQMQTDPGEAVRRRPILGALDQIENRDALLTPEGDEAPWPHAHSIVGNPPFLGEKLWRRQLGDAHTERIRTAYRGAVPPRADLVVYWIEKARRLAAEGKVGAFGFVATKAITKGASRSALDLIVANSALSITDAWTNEPWVVAGAQVRVSMIAVQAGSVATARLNGGVVKSILADLTPGHRGFDVTKAAQLNENKGVSFQGLKLGGPFQVEGATARRLLALPLNPSGHPNSNVLKILFDIDDVVDRPSDRWVIDMSACRTEELAAEYHAPFELIRQRDREAEALREREGSEDTGRSRRATGKPWRPVRPRPKLRKAIAPLRHYILTPETSKYRLFRIVTPTVLPTGSLFAIARDDATSLGVLHSTFHEVWSTAQGNRLGVGNDRRYNATSTFETFPFPEGLTPNIPAAQYAADPRAQHIAAAAKALNDKREAWLNPPELVKRVPEVVPGYPDRVLPKNDDAAATLKDRTLTKLYNERPAWLGFAHRDLDRAVAAAYGWEESLADRAQPENPDAADRAAAEEEILKRLFALNQERAKKEKAG